MERFSRILRGGVGYKQVEIIRRPLGSIAGDNEAGQDGRQGDEGNNCSLVVRAILC